MLQLDIDDWDGVEVSVVLAKVIHYIRSMGTGRVAVDLSSISDRTVNDKNTGSFEESSEEQQQQQQSDEDTYGLNYMGGKGGRQQDGKGGKVGKGDEKTEKKQFEGYCNYCWKYGHRAAECYQNPKGKRQRTIPAAAKRQVCMERSQREFIMGPGERRQPG